MEAFGNAFAIDDMDRGKTIKAVDGYFDHPNGWHIQVTVWENDEGRFYEFLQTFCIMNNLTFRDPRSSKPSIF
jgi:hypothetical protein